MNKQDEKAEAYFREHYTTLVDLPFQAERPNVIRDSGDRRCRFCGRTHPEVTFRNDAHAVPESLGNKSIRSWNECDECNHFLANTCEDHLGRWSLYARALSQVPGKNGAPKYKNRDKSFGVESKNGRLDIHITDPDLTYALQQEGAEVKFQLPLEATSPTYVPLNAAKALVKIACSICPEDELAQCKPAVDWVMGRPSFTVKPFLVFYGFTPGPIDDNSSRAVLLKRRTSELEPFFWLVLQIRHHRLQVIVPGCPADKELFSQPKPTFPAWHFRFPEFGPGWPAGETEYHRLDWSSEESIHTAPKATLHVAHGVKLAPSHADDDENLS